MVSIDEKIMKMCFNLAKKGGVNVLPNPLVGCVILKDDRIISKGYHQKYGEFHAERNAILKSNDKDLKGSTLYVNLEPCSHYGKTPPCADLIIEKKIKRVIFSNFDPNPKVNGGGIKKLKLAGIEVIEGVLEEEGKELNKVFFKNIIKKLPYVAIKTGTTLDSKIAADNHLSKWITNDSSRGEVMKLRSSYQAILTGSNTVYYDNPKLTARIKGGINPIRIIKDTKGITDLSSNVYNDDNTRVIVIDNTKRKYPNHIEKIEYENMETLMKTLYEMGIYSILTEAGGGLTGALIKHNMADEIYQFIAPKIAGCGIDFVRGLNFNSPNDFIKVQNIKIKKIKDDILLNYKIEK